MGLFDGLLVVDWRIGRLMRKKGLAQQKESFKPIDCVTRDVVSLM
jgi:hypothetical protein